MTQNIEPLIAKSKVKCTVPSGSRRAAAGPERTFPGFSVKEFNVIF